MTPEDKQIAIAEACGLFRIAPMKRTTRKGNDDPNGVVLWFCSEDHGGAKTYDKVPNYLKDRNAMLDAVSIKILPTRRDDYQNWLSRTVDKKHRMATTTWLCITAEAEDHADAFLATLNLLKP